MSTHIFDIDGTLVNYHDNTWIEGAKEMLLDIHKRGDDIILITMRGPQDDQTLWSIENTKDTILKDLDEIGIRYRILFNVQSPRVIHDDSKIYVDQRKTNQKYTV